MVAKLKVRPIVPTKGHDDDVCFCYFVFDDDASPGINLYFNITAKHSGLHLDMINNDPPLRSQSRKHQHRQCLHWKPRRENRKICLPEVTLKSKRRHKAINFLTLLVTLIDVANC